MVPTRLILLITPLHATASRLDTLTMNVIRHLINHKNLNCFTFAGVLH